MSKYICSSYGCTAIDLQVLGSNDMQRIHGTKIKSNQYSLIPAATAWVVVIDVGHSRQHVNWERHIGKINGLSAILG